MRHCQVKQSLDGRTLVTICFAANIAITLELALVTLQWAFAAVGKLVSG